MPAFGLHTSGSPAAWLAFGAIIAVMLALDLGVFHRKPHAVGAREALSWSAVWFGLALAFGGFVYLHMGADAGSEFMSGYLIEKSLSLDNVFVFSVIFSSFRIPVQHQHRVLFWGVLGALVTRALMIVLGASLLQHFHWLGYIFGAFLVLTGVRLFLHRDAELSGENWMARWTRRFLPATDRLDGSHFVTRIDGKLLATPLLLALCVVELSDVVFAVDSIPAVLAVTDDPFIVFSSNVFAMLGLRSLYVLLAGFVESFRHLKTGLAAVLVFVGAKMSLVDVYKVSPLWSLLVISVLLGAAIAASILERRVHAARLSRQQAAPAKNAGAA